MDDIVDVNTLFGPLPAAASDLSVDDLAALMREHAVSTCCTLSTVGLLLDHNAGNAATRAACSESPSLVPVATVNPQAFFGGDGPHNRFRADGFKMARFFPHAQGWEPSYAPFIALARALQGEQLPIMMSIDLPGTASRLIRALGSHPSPVILAGVDERTLAEALVLMEEHPSVYLETSSLLAAGALAHVVRIVGAERVMFGSGAPARPMAAGISVLRHAGLSDAESSRVLAGTAREVLAI